MEKYTLELNQDQIEYLFDILTAEAHYREPSEDNYDISDKDFYNLEQKVWLKSLSYKKYAEGNF